jgi:hypothetical protein
MSGTCGSGSSSLAASSAPTSSTSPTTPGGAARTGIPFGALRSAILALVRHRPYRCQAYCPLQAAWRRVLRRPRCPPFHLRPHPPPHPAIRHAPPAPPSGP